MDDNLKAHLLVSIETVIDEALPFLATNTNNDALNTEIVGMMKNNAEIVCKHFSENQRVISIANKIIERVNNLNYPFEYKGLNQLYGFYKDLYTQIKSNSNRIKAVFFPYKASMWSSLHTIWEAAVSDYECDAKIVPIPYYEKKSNNSLGSIFYELNEYYEDLPVISYKKYDVRHEKPDVAFIIYPYEDMNTVTQIESDYFARNLCKYVGKVVYIPYFCPHFRGQHHYFLPAMDYAWKGFFLDESIRNDLISEGYPPDKIVALGSARIDMALRLFENKESLPKKWEAKLYNKRVIMLNMHLINFMQDEYDPIATLYSTCERLTAHENIAVIVRPHPLIEATIKTYMPHLLKNYKKMLYEINNNNKMVLDLSADYYPAMLASHAYVGNFSSLITEYGFSGKPMYISAKKDYFDKTRNLLSLNTAFNMDTMNLNDFIKMVAEDSFTKSAEQINEFKRNLPLCTGNSGLNIWNYVKSNLMAERGNAND